MANISLTWLEDLRGAPNKLTVIRLRWLVIILCSYLLLFSPEIWLAPVLVQGFVLFYILTNVALCFTEKSLFKSSYFYSPLVIFDTLFVTFSLVITGNLETDFYLTYFLVIILSGFWQDFRWSLGFGVVITSLYGLFLFLAEAPDLGMVLRVPFLFVTSLFYGYFTQVVRTEKTLREKAEQEAGRDFLTGLSNRRAFEQKIEEELERARRYKRPLCVLMLDIDNFKMVNDTYGHQWGDDVLKEVGRYLSDKKRRSDFPARYGGEEFVLILPETSLENALVVANRIRLGVKETVFDTINGSFSVTVSIGISSNSKSENSDYHQMLVEADQALYHAKNNNRDRVEVFPLKARLNGGLICL